MHFNKPLFASNIFSYGAVVVQCGVVAFLSFYMVRVRLRFKKLPPLSETTPVSGSSTLTLCVRTKDQPSYLSCLKFVPDYFLVVVSSDLCIFLLLKYYGGHVASPFIPDDMEFINMAIQATRQDGKPPVPIWVTTEDDLVCVYIRSSELFFTEPSGKPLIQICVEGTY